MYKLLIYGILYINELFKITFVIVIKEPLPAKSINFEKNTLVFITNHFGIQTMQTTTISVGLCQILAPKSNYLEI